MFCLSYKNTNKNDVIYKFNFFELRKGFENLKDKISKVRSLSYKLKKIFFIDLVAQLKKTEFKIV